jgi:excisionase family DNA binding protein
MYAARFVPETVQEETYSLAESAVAANKSVDTIKRWTKLGWLDTVRVGRSVRITRQSLERLLNDPPAGAR